MRAIRYHRHGGPEVLQYEDVPDPTPGAGDVLVDVKAIAVSPIHWKVAQGDPGLKGAPLPQIPGSECAGVTTDGRRVVLAGGGHGSSRPGVYAEKIAAAASSLVDIPDEVDFASAASLGVAYSTAWLSLAARAALQPGERVLILGATGGVGSGAVQIAKLLGASQVIAAARADAADAVRALGADVVIDPAPEGLAAAVAAATSNAGVNVVLDPIGGAVGSAALGALATGGRQVMLGTSAGPRYDFAVTTLYRKNASLLGFSMFGFPDRLVPTMKELLAAIAAGRLTVPIDRTFPLAEAAAAWRHTEGRGKLGKVILTP